MFNLFDLVLFMMPLLAIINPICGDGTAKSLFESHVIPLLHSHGHALDKVYTTKHAGHAGKLLVDFLETVPGQVTVVLGSGDGTLHEIINCVSATDIKGLRDGEPFTRLYFVLIPCGTANALYSSLFPPSSEENDPSYKLKSLHSFINNLRTIPLTLAITTLSSPPFQRRKPTAAVGVVVVSTSLHASILHESEQLRHEIPGIERFKVAARKNSSKWYNGSVKLFPVSSKDCVEIYDPSTKSFAPHPDWDGDDPIIDIDGPFTYFLSTVNVDRLEPQFRITPLATDIPPADATLDIVIVRPLRDPSVTWDNPEARQAFVAKLWRVLGAAYQNGTHIDLRYDPKGDIVTGGDGLPVVEYVRAGGWEWLPDDADESAHFLCADGEISVVERNGRALCSAAVPDDTAGFVVYA